MKFVISSSELLKATMAISKAIPAKSANPILENFLFNLSGESLEITASDQELTLRTSVNVSSCEEEGRMAVPAKHIMELLKELPDQPLKITSVSDSAFECNWSSGTSTLPFFPAEDYPDITGADDAAIEVTFPAQVLLEGINSTIYATADDEIRPTMNGILFDIDTTGSTFVATDAHKLICYSTSEVKSEEKSSFILHKKPASILKSLIGKDTDSVEVAFDTKSAVFNFGSTTVICRLIVGRFPKYRDVIPQNNANILKIDRAVLMNAVKRISVCANRASNQIKLDLRADSLEISAQDLGFSIAAYEKVACSYDGDNLSIGFKSTFLVEILNNLTCENVVMKFADSKRATLIVPSEDEEESGKICGILMPITFN